MSGQPPWVQGRAARYIWHSPSGVPLDLLGFKVYQINKPFEILVYNNVLSDIGEISETAWSTGGGFSGSKGGAALGVVPGKGSRTNFLIWAMILDTEGLPA